ncbi:hypothetical protein J5N97_025465 [Dioscorea zingiberensis]|uniref:Uncharacterized protein n=1 Tax=Dioscorea zingiberensis TaxID=325984 RepID=A0A9D5C939_9LILI|nr:hypothetical protein J5N97_025465 [Dioscorea zingiberensis]
MTTITAATVSAKRRHGGRCMDYCLFSRLILISGPDISTPAATTTTAKWTWLTLPDTIRERGDEFRIPAQDQKGKKKADRSSCGSNTPSSSEIDIVNATEKANAEESKETSQHCAGFPLSSETNHRQFRGSGMMNEAWKEVSEEGRIAFQALFKREILPQSFSLWHLNEKGATALPVDLNRNVFSSTYPDHTEKSQTDPTLMISNENSGKSCIISEPDQFKLKAHRTGFKPYKRCSVESKENRVASGEDQVNKRIRLEAEASN